VRTKPLLPPSLSIPCSKAESITVDTDFTLRAVEGWLDLGCPQAALEELGERRDSDEAKVLWYRVQIARDLGQGIEAIRLGTRLTAREPGDPAGWLLLASVCVYPALHPDWAIRALKTGLVYIPGNLHLLEALIHLVQEKDSTSVEETTLPKETNPAHPMLPGIGGEWPRSIGESSVQ
jgi:hypothetical protein